MSPGHGKKAHLDLADSTNSTTKQGNVDDIKAHFEGLSTREHDDSDRPRSHSGSQVSSIPHMQEGRASVYSSDDEISESEDDAQEDDYVVSGDGKSVIDQEDHHSQVPSHQSSELVVYRSRSTSPHVVPASKDHPSTGPDHSTSDRKVGCTPSTKDRKRRKHRSDQPRSAGDPVPGHRRSHTSQGKTKTGTGNFFSKALPNLMKAVPVDRGWVPTLVTTETAKKERPRKHRSDKQTTDGKPSRRAHRREEPEEPEGVEEGRAVETGGKDQGDQHVVNEIGRAAATGRASQTVRSHHR